MTELPGLVWDTCCLLNLMATRCAPAILEGLGTKSFVVRQVREGEVIYLRPLPEEDSAGPLVSADVAALIAAGVLQDIELDVAEFATFARFAAELDDGAAQSLATAVHRGLWIVTDDRRSMRLARELEPPVPTMTTPDWVWHWSETAGINRVELLEVIRRIELCARYWPPSRHPRMVWWDSLAQSDLWNR